MTALTAYLTSTNDPSTLTTARELTNSAPASETSAASGQFAKSGTGWTELYAQGANATLAGTEPSPSGHGFLWDVTSLEGQQIAAGNWTPTIKLSTGGGTFTVTIVVRAFVRSSAGVYTQIGSNLSLAGVSLSSTATAHAFAAKSLAAKTFNVGDKLYVDVLLDITTGSSSSTASQRVISLFENGGANDAIVTPGYSPAPVVYADSPSGAASPSGRVTDALRVSVSPTGTAAPAGALADGLVHTERPSGAASPSGAISAALLYTSVVSGGASPLGTITESWAGGTVFRDSPSGGQSPSGGLLESVRFSDHFAGLGAALGSVSQALLHASAPSGVASPAGALVQGLVHASVPVGLASPSGALAGGNADVPWTARRSRRRPYDGACA